MLYVLEVKVNSHWEEVTRFDAADSGEALRAALHHLTREHYGKPVTLRPILPNDPRTPAPS